MILIVSLEKAKLGMVEWSINDNLLGYVNELKGSNMAMMIPDPVGKIHNSYLEKLNLYGNRLVALENT